MWSVLALVQDLLGLAVALVQVQDQSPQEKDSQDLTCHQYMRCK
jgi:hypothetical protein